MSIPNVVAKYFWGDDLGELSVKQHGKYIAQVLLERRDSDAVRWLFSIFSAEQLLFLLPTLKVSEKSAHFWSIYLAY